MFYKNSETWFQNQRTFIHLLLLLMFCTTCHPTSYRFLITLSPDSHKRLTYLHHNDQYWIQFAKVFVMRRFKCASFTMILLVFVYFFKFEMSVFDFLIRLDNIKNAQNRLFHSKTAPLFNLTELKFNFNNPTCEFIPSIHIVVIVHSATQNRKARDIIR